LRITRTYNEVTLRRIAKVVVIAILTSIIARLPATQSKRIARSIMTALSSLID
jgi:hypothetical protein